MQRSIFTEEQEMFRDAYRKFLISEVKPNRDKWREAGMVPADMYRKMGEQGYLLLWADEKYGGLGIKDFRYAQIMIEEDVVHGDVCFFHILHSQLVAPYIDHFGDEEQKQRFLPPCISGEKILAIAMTEPDTGSDLAGMKTRADDRGDHWVLNGAKTFISNGIVSDIVIVAAKTNPDNPREIGLFFVERGMEGFERGRKLKKMGLHAQDTAELFFNDVKIPKANVLGDPAKGFHYLMHGLAEERLLGTVGYLASARRAFEVTHDYVLNRKAFKQRLADFQNTRFKMAEMSMEIDMAQCYVDHCVAVHNEGKLDNDMAAKGKLFCSELEGRMTDLGVQLHGGNGYMEEYEICRLYTNARISRIYAGSSEIMKEIIARSIFDKR